MHDIEVGILIYSGGQGLTLSMLGKIVSIGDNLREISNPVFWDDDDDLVFHVPFNII